MSSPKPSSPSRSEPRRCIVRIFLPENMGSGHLSFAYEPHLSIGELRHQCMDTIRKKRHISHPLTSSLTQSPTSSPPSSPRLIGVDTSKLDVVTEEGDDGNERLNEKQYGLALRHGTSADWDRNFDQATILADNKMLADFHPDKSRFIEFNLYHIDEQEQHPRSVANTLYSRSFSPKASVTISTFSPPHGNSAPTTFNLAAFSRSNTGGTTAGTSPPISPSTSPRISTTPAVASVPWSDDAPTRERGYAHSPDPIEEVRCGVLTCTNVDTSGRGYCNEHANRVPDFNSPIPTSPLTQLSTISIPQSGPTTSAVSVAASSPKPSSILSTSASPPKSTSSLPPPSPSSPRQATSLLKSATPPTSSSMPHTHTGSSPSSSPAMSPTGASPRTISGDTAARPAMPQRRAPTVPPASMSSSPAIINTSNASRPISPAPRSPSPATVTASSPPASNPASPSSFTRPLASNHVSTTPTPSSSTSTPIPTGPLSPGHPDACAHCHVMLVATNYVTVLNKKYHPDHFCCKQCGVKLIGQKFRAHANEPYCPADYDELFAKKCFACHKAIAGQCLTLDGESYHPDCFKCCKCQCDLSNQRLNTHDGKMYCEKDYHTAFGTQCVGCGEPIIDRILTALDATWHVNCFMCSHCLKPLEGTKFFLKNEHVYCPEDYDLLFSIRCGGCHDKIIGSYIIVESLEQKFHPNCLKCCYCQVNLHDRPFFCDDNSDDIYCREHYEAMVAVKCASCQQFITGTVLHAAGRTYHDECFECFVCQQELDDGSYILDSDGHLFCQQHVSSATGDIIHGTTGGRTTPRDRPTSPTTSVRSSVAPIPIPPSKGNALTNAIHRVKQTISSNPNATVTPSAPTSTPAAPASTSASAATSASASASTSTSTSAAPSTREATPPPQVDPNAGAAVVTIATTAPEQALTQDSHAPPQEEHVSTPASPSTSPSPSPSSNTRSIASPSPTSSTRSVNPSSPSSTAPVSISVSSSSSTSSVSRLPLSPISATDDPLRLPSIIPTSSIFSVKSSSSSSSTSLSSIKPITIMNGSGSQIESRASTVSTISNGSVDDSDDSDDEDSPKKKKKKKSPVQAVKGKGVTWTPSELCEFICAGIEASLAYRDETFRSDYRKKDLYRLMHKNIQYQFQDYAPRIFLMMRRQYGISQTSYIKSICKGGIHGGALGAGKSGMLFYFSNDNRYVVKTITRGELKFFRKILRPYYTHFTQHTHTMLPRFFGIYKITMPGQKPLRLIVMNNLFDFPIQIHTKFDLKGSTRNRFVKNEAKASVLKDLNFKTKIFVGATQKKAIMHQLKIDSEFLVKANIMDQSLLLGIHNGGDDELNDSQTPINVRSLTKPMQTDVYHGDGLMLSVFQSNKGGLRGFDDDGSKTPKPRRELYIMGVIDILQEFNVRKMLESTYKGIRYNKNTISAIASREYADRFLKYLDEHME